jgi:hypothetical protein
LDSFFLRFFDLTAEPDDHVVGEDRSLDGDRAELRAVDPGLHGALTAHGRADPLSGARTPQNRPREASHGTEPPNSRGGHPGRWSVLVGPDSAKPTYTFQR